MSGDENVVCVRAKVDETFREVNCSSLKYYSTTHKYVIEIIIYYYIYYKNIAVNRKYVYIQYDYNIVVYAYIAWVYR
jgi:hypothetical protein